MVQITEILLFLWMQLLQRSKITIWERHLFLEKVYGSFGFVFTLHKRVFSGAPVKYFSLYGPNNSDSVVFRNAAFGEIRDHSLRKTPFQKKYLWEFWVLVTLKKLFSRALVKCFSLHGSNNSDSVVYQNADFAEIKYHTSSTINF